HTLTPALHTPSLHDALPICSSWRQRRSVALGMLIGIVQDVASRAVPQVMDYLSGNRDRARIRPYDDHGERRGPPRQQEPLQAARDRKSTRVNSSHSQISYAG